ncbi:MAG: LysM peptidoglycan-binding domain-containing protein [Anaerolineae bacterium]
MERLNRLNTKGIWARLLAAILIAAQLALWAAPVQAASPQEPTVVYVVRLGETLSTLAQHYDTTVEAIAQANHITDPRLIQVGQQLTIPTSGTTPPPWPTTYVVQHGDTLSLIARRYNTTVHALAELNSILDPNLIHVDQRLLIPSAADSPPPPLSSQIHIVQAGETLTRIASRYGTTVSAIAAANDLADPSLIFVGQRLVIPGSATSAPLPSPFVAVELKPHPVIQGQTLAIKVQTAGPVSLAGSFTSTGLSASTSTGLSASDHRPLTFVGESSPYWALVGIRATAQVGPYSLELTATDSAGKTTRASELAQVAAGDFATEQIVLSSETSKLLDPALIRAENERLSQVFGIFSHQQWWEGLFRIPLQGPVRVTSAFGTRRSYSGGPPTSYHGGIDYGAEVGTPVLAAGRGRVALAEELTERGNAVIIDHGLGVYSGYYHLSEIAVEAGQEVERGDLIGRVGSTGLSTGSHLHWEIRVGGVYVDPLQWTRRVFP